MAKKTFTASPLMNFITPAAPAQTDAPKEAPAEAAEGQESAAAINDTPAPENAPKAPETAQQTGTPGTDQTEAPAPAKKTRKDYCRTPAEERARIAEQNARFRSAPPTPPEYFAKPDTEETRSRRVQLLIKPSIYKEIRGIAHWKRQSFNNLIEEILADYLKTHDHRGETK